MRMRTYVWARHYPRPPGPHTFIHMAWPAHAITSSLTSGVGVPVDAIACMHMHTSMRTLTLPECTHYAQICTEAGLPPGVFNVITGGGAMGSKMAAHPLVDKVGCSWPDSLLGLVVLAAAVNSRYCSS